MNTNQITLRETIIGAGLSLSAAERTAMELEYLLNGYNGINNTAEGLETPEGPPGICESAHDLSCRIQRLAELLETVRGMMAPAQTVGQNAATSTVTWAKGEIFRP